MCEQYEISDADWEQVADLFASRRRAGRPRADDRLMLNGVLWVGCSGLAWRNLPESYGPWSTVYQRWRDWKQMGAFNKMLKRLHASAEVQGVAHPMACCIAALTVPPCKRLRHPRRSETPTPLTRITP